MRINFLFKFLILLLFLNGVTFAEKNNEKIVFSWRKLENKKFIVGEKLLFKIKWGIIPAGYATLEIPEIIEINNRQAYRITSRAWSNSFFDIFYKVRDYNESWLDVESLCSLGYEKHLHEGGYVKDERTIFDQEKGIAIIEGESLQIPISTFIQDVLSGLYYMRTQNLNFGEIYSIDVNSNRKNWPLVVKVITREEVEVPSGKFDCWLIEPFLKEEGIFQHRGRILIWLTADEKKMPVLLQTKIPFGSINAELIEIKN